MGAKKEWKDLQPGHTIVESERERRKRPRNTSRNECLKKKKCRQPEDWTWTRNTFSCRRERESETNSLLSDSLVSFFSHFSWHGIWRMCATEIISREEISAREPQSASRDEVQECCEARRGKLGHVGGRRISKQIVPFWGNFAHCHRSQFMIAGSTAVWLLLSYCSKKHFLTKHIRRNSFLASHVSLVDSITECDVTSNVTPTNQHISRYF